MSSAAFRPHVVSVTDATARGVAGLVRDAEQGADVLVARHGRPVAAVVSIERLDRLNALEAELREIALVLARAATDSGHRVGLDEAISEFGFDRGELEAEPQRSREQCQRLRQRSAAPHSSPLRCEPRKCCRIGSG